MRRVLFLYLFILSQTIFAEDIDSLLNELSKKDDLSFYTKKEAAGFIKIFTREDLDRMKIQSFGEIIDKIPFLRNKLDNYGLNDPYYKPYQITSPSKIRIYINDREIITPLFGTGLKLLGQMDIGYIDHIEVYLGMPSYDISIETSIVVIKAYTKIGERENTSTIGATIGPHNSLDTYTYKSEKLEDYSYFTYVDHRDLNRDKVYNLGSELSRDKTTTNIFTQLTNDTSSLDLQVVDGKIDNFAGRSWNMTPDEAKTDFTYLSAGYTYESLDKSFKSILNYSYIEDTKTDSSASPLGLRSISTAPFLATYNQLEANVVEHLLDLKITKKVKLNDTTILFGVSNRFKKFTIKDYTLDNVDYSSIFTYDSEDVLSLFTEITHNIDKQNKLILAVNGQKYFEDGDIDSETIYGVKLGHIYKKDGFTQKSFIFYVKFHPSSLTLLINDEESSGLYNVESEKAYSIATQSLWQYKNMNFSLLLSRNVYQNAIYRDELGFHNDSNKFIFDTSSFDITYFLGSNDKIDFNFWAVFSDYSENHLDRYKEEYGGYISLYKKFYDIDTYNSLSYVTGKSGLSDGWNYNVTLSYTYSKRLSLFLKGINLLDKAYESDYISVNPITSEVIKLDNISNIDRSIWFGLEYQF